jgi:DDE family transposase
MKMTTEDIIIHIFCHVDDRLKGEPTIVKHPQAKLYPSELVTIGLLFALKGGYFRSFYRWLQRDFAALFGGLPERSRLQRALRVHQGWCQYFLASPTLFTVIDSYGIELLHPARETRSQQPLGKKGKSNRRWMVGVKLCWLVNDRGQVVAWDWDTANLHDQTFRPVAHQFDGDTITLCDRGFVKVGEATRNLKVCAVKTWSQRMLIETVFSLLTRVFHLKQLFHRTAPHLSAHFAYAAAIFNLLVGWSGSLHIAQFAL